MQGDDEFYRAPLLWLLAPYLAGLTAACAGVGNASSVIAGVAAIAALSAVWMARSGGRLRMNVWMLLTGSAAFLGGLAHMHHAIREQPRWNSLPHREVRCKVEVLRVFSSSPNAQRQSCIGVIREAPAPVRDLAGQRVFFSLRSPQEDGPLLRSSRLVIGGILTPLGSTVPPAGSFEAYLLSTAVRFRIERAQNLETVEAASFLPRLWHRLGMRFETILRHGLPGNHPATNAYLAMMLGKKAELSSGQKETFLRSGTMHLFAISGLHIGVIAVSLYSLLAACRVPPRVGMIIGLILLGIFVESTGGTPSERRALVMVIFLWAGATWRRPSNPLASLVVSALVVLVVDPLALLSTSFQLSYSVVAAILLYGAPLRNRWLEHWQPFRDFPEDEWRWWQRSVRDVGRGVITLFCASISATMVSAPLGLSAFGVATPGALLTNIAVIPLAGVAITGGFASLVTGLAGLFPASHLFNHASALIVHGIETGVGLAASVPFAFVAGGFESPWSAPAIALALISICLTGYALGWRRLPGGLWGPPLAAAVAILLLARPTGLEQESAAMKSAYELAMERLQESDPDESAPLTAPQKTELAEIDKVYTGKIAEREIFLNQRLAESRSTQDFEEVEKIRKQIASERARLEEEREDAKNRIRRGSSGGESKNQ